MNFSPIYLDGGASILPLENLFGFYYFNGRPLLILQRFDYICSGTQIFPTKNIAFAAVRVWKTFLPDKSTILTSTSWLLALSAMIENCAREGLGNAVIRSFIVAFEACRELVVTKSDAPGQTGAVKNYNYRAKQHNFSHL
jgi:hypothetical protein